MQFEKRLANFGIFSATLVFILCLSVIVVGRMFPGELRAMPGSQAPEISLRDSDNQDLRLSEFRGSCVLVYFAPDLTEPIDSVRRQHGTASNAADEAELSKAREQTRIHDLARLSEYSRALGAQEVTVVESRHLADPSGVQGAMSLLSLVSQADPENRRANHMLLDIDGDIARRFKVDSIAVQPTLFVIDGNGVIRYRGDCETASADDAIRRLSPAANKQISLNSADAISTSAISHLSTVGVFGLGGL